MGKKEDAKAKGSTKKKEDFWNKPMNKGGKPAKKKWSKARTNEKLKKKSTWTMILNRSSSTRSPSRTA